MGRKLLALGTLVITLAVSAVAAASGWSPNSTDEAVHAHTASAGSPSAVKLRLKLATLFQEHTTLALVATQKGLEGSKGFAASAKGLDANSVAIANAIGSVYGSKVRNQFLNGKFLWRDHIRFFVDYTVATAKKDKVAQDKAVNNLLAYVGAFSKFLADATGLPQKALAHGITAHVLGLKASVDAYAAGDHAKAFAELRKANVHMVMTGDTLADAIAKKFPHKFAK